jgi:hypothetical protein
VYPACDDGNFVQPNLSNADSAIVRQTVFGADEDWSSAQFVAANSNDNVYFAGLHNLEDVVGRIANPSGIDWALTPAIEFLGLRVLPASFGASSEVVMAVGAKYDARDATIIGYDVSGNVLTENSFGYPGHKTWLSDIVMVSGTPTESRFVAAGTARRSGVRYPYLCDVTLSSTGDIVTSRERIDLDYPRAGVWMLVWNGDADTVLFFGAVDRFDADDELAGGEVFCFDGSLTVAWTQSVKPAGAGWATTEGIDYFDGSVYTAGRVSVFNDDGWRRAGMVASLSETGDVNWTKSVILSAFTDRYWGCKVDDGALYAVGEYSSVEQRSTTHVFGYGLLTKFELPTGNIIYHKSFGDPDYSSHFRAIDVNGTRAFCGGVTERYLKDYWHKGWFVEVDLGDQQTQLAPPAQLRSSSQASLKPVPLGRRFGRER